MSNLNVRAKLGMLALLFALAMLFGIWQSYSNASLKVEPARAELVGISLNQKVFDTQQKFGEYYLAFAEGGDLKGPGGEAYKAYNDLKDALDSSYGEDARKSLLQPIAGNADILEGLMDSGSSDGALGEDFDKLLVGFGNVAVSIGQRSSLYQNPNSVLALGAEKVYGSLLPASSMVTSLAGMGGGGDDDLDSDDLDDDAGLDSDLDGGGERKSNLQLNLGNLSSSFASYADAAKVDKKSPKAIRDLIIPQLDDAAESDLTPAELLQIRETSKTYVDTFHAALKSDVEARISSAKSSQVFQMIVAIGVLAIGLGGCVFIANDVLLGVTNANKVATAIAREGDVSMGLKYEGKRGDELGGLLDEMAYMCKSLDKSAGIAENISTGDLRGADISPLSEQDRMGKALQNMVGSLRDQIGETKSNAASVAETAKNILAATSQVAATANQMATSISEATTTAEEVRQTANLAEQKAKSVAQSAGEAASVSVVGQKQTQMTLDEMEKIRKQMETIAESIVRLSEQGQAIGDIITTVNDIAEQSNVLAVNASIEAAKAGEHGRGFAVVAQEVKSLADESKTATSAIRAILSDIERATAAAVMLAEQGTKSAQASVDRSKEAGSSIKDLGTRVVQAAQSSAQISASASQQLAGVDQVVDAMVSIKDGSGQIVDSVNQVKQAAEELSGLSATLEKNIQSYKV